MVDLVASSRRLERVILPQLQSMLQESKTKASDSAQQLASLAASSGQHKETRLQLLQRYQLSVPPSNSSAAGGITLDSLRSKLDALLAATNERIAAAGVDLGNATAAPQNVLRTLADLRQFSIHLGAHVAHERARALSVDPSRSHRSDSPSEQLYTALHVGEQALALWRLLTAAEETPTPFSSILSAARELEVADKATQQRTRELTASLEATRREIEELGAALKRLTTEDKPRLDAALKEAAAPPKKGLFGLLG